ncbi:MAG: c-type cytochrome [Woeseia sp.]
MKRTSVLAALLITLSATFSAAALADETVIPADEFVYCTVCHGIQMSGNSVIQAPRLSGMERWYTSRQLQSFKNGWRGAHADDTYGQEMRPMAEVLTDKEMTAVATYVRSVSSAPPAITVQGDVNKGKALFASCAACHKADASGNELLASPPLSGLNDWYLLTQLKNFKSGVRGSNPEDVYGMQMQAAAGLLADEQAMKDVVRYIASLRK